MMHFKWRANHPHSPSLFATTDAASVYLFASVTMTETLLTGSR